MTTPLTNPAYAPVVPRFTDREYLNIVYRTDAEALRAVVPEPLEIDEARDRKQLAVLFAFRIVENAEITLTDVRVPEANRLQGINSFRDVAEILRATRGGVAWQALSVMIGAYELALDYAKERKQFGRPIARFQLVQDLLVKSLGNITASWGMLVQLARLQDAGIFKDEHSSLAKAFVTSRMREVVAWGREIFGGNGIVLDNDIMRFFTDAETIYSFEGTREMNTLIVGKAITGQSAFV